MPAARPIAELMPGARLLTIGGGGHLPQVRDPVAFCSAVRDFVGPRPARSTWVRAMARKRRALFISSAIGLGHVQRDLAIAREMRKLQPELEIDWFTVDPAASYLEREGERLHPITAAPGQREPALRGHGRRARPAGLLRAAHDGRGDGAQLPDLRRPGRGPEHYDIVIGDEAWEVDYHYHENPELKRQPFVFLTDFVGCLPMEEGNEREAYPVRRPQCRRHRTRGALPVDPRPRDLRRQPRGHARPAFRPGPAEHPRLDEAQLRLHRLRAALRPAKPGRHRAAARAPRLPAGREAGHRRDRRHRGRCAAAAQDRRTPSRR